MKKKNRSIITLECIEGKKNKRSRYYISKNLKKQKNKIKLKKYNYILRKRTIHKEK